MLIGLVVALGASIYLFYLAKSANVETLKSGLSESTRVYDESGKEVGKLFGQKDFLWNWIIFLLYSKTRLFQLKIAGFINIKGIPSGIARAVVGKLTFGKIGGGGGGSTITQQLAKNVLNARTNVR